MTIARRCAIALSVVALSLCSCRKDGERYDHSEEHPEGHDHHEDDHGHDEPMIRITRWSEELELFAEHAPAVVGKELSLLAHLTVLDGFRPLESGEVELRLQGPATLEARGSLVRPGIFRVIVTPTAAGTYRGRLKASDRKAVEGIEIAVHASEETARAAVTELSHAGVIELLKEQQWAVPFGTAFALKGSLVAAIQVAGNVDTPPDGSAEVGAPVAGRVVAPAKGLPRPGIEVKKGQALASLVPAPSSPEDAARARLLVVEAEARDAAAKKALERAERLLEDEAIAERELEDARREARVSEEALRTAKRAASFFAGASEGTSAGSWKLAAPIDGTLVEVRAKPGASVSPGDVLFRIVDTSELWIRARVPEQDAARLRTDEDAQYQIAGLDEWHDIDVTGDDAAASIVTVGKTVDRVTRTVDVIYALRDGAAALRVGGLVQVAVPVGGPFHGIVVPSGAVLDDDGRSLVYVQLDGEHFAERSVRVGARSGGRVGIVQGLSKGDRIVVRGANVVRLAARKKGGGEAHGHVH